MKIFIQDWGILPNETLVCVNKDYDEILLWLKKKKYKNDFFVKWEKKFNKLISDGNCGFCIIDDDGTSMLWLKKYDNNWEYIEILLHEIHHLIFYVSNYKNFKNEPEMQAYLFEYLFRHIRKNLKKSEVK